MALTRSKASSIFTPQGNSLAVFIDVNDGELKLKDVFGGVASLNDVLNLTELTVDKLAFNTSYVYTSLATGELAWNDMEKTVDLRMGNGGGVISHLGQSLAYPLVVNKSGGTLVGGTLVMVDPTQVSQGNRLRVVQAVSNGTYPVDLIVGITNEPIDDNQEGFATWFGYVRKLSLSALKPVGETWVEGDILYSNPSIAGGLTKVKPSQPNWDNTICAITSINGNNLTLLVRPSLFVTTQESMRLTERLTLESDSTATTQSTAVIRNVTTNSGIAIVPNGTGAITASIPDGTVAGGNARGTNAVDLQMQRSNTLGVASGNFSVISGGSANRNSGQLSTISGGFLNVATSSYNFIGGGQQNTTSSEYSTISGGQSNTASTGTHATVVGGLSNTSSGQYSISGGHDNTASGTYSIALGHLNTASGLRSCVIGQQNSAIGAYSFSQGFQNRADANYSVALNALNIASKDFSLATGLRSNAYLYGAHSQASGNFSGGAGAQCQQSTMTAFRSATLSSTETTVLSLNGSGVTELIIPNTNLGVWNVTVKTVAIIQSTTGTTTGVALGDVFMENKSILFKKLVFNSTLVDLATDNTFADGGMGTSIMSYTVGASQELALTYTAPIFTGGGTVNIRIISKIDLVELL